MSITWFQSGFDDSMIKSAVKLFHNKIIELFSQTFLCIFDNYFQTDIYFKYLKAIDLINIVLESIFKFKLWVIVRKS